MKKWFIWTLDSRLTRKNSGPGLVGGQGKVDEIGIVGRQGGRRWTRDGRWTRVNMWTKEKRCTRDSKLTRESRWTRDSR